MNEDIKLPDFNIESIMKEQTSKINTRLILLNTKPGLASEYLVTAFPVNAKEQGEVFERPYTVMTWPEVVLGIMVETEDDGNQTGGNEKSWALHPTLQNGRGWRKKSIMKVRGRDCAARLLLDWTAKQNEKRSTRRGSK